MTDSPQLKRLQWWWGIDPNVSPVLADGGIDIVRYRCNELDSLDLYLNIVFVYIDWYYIDFKPLPQICPHGPFNTTFPAEKFEVESKRADLCAEWCCGVRATNVTSIVCLPCELCPKSIPGFHTFKTT